MTVYLIGPRPDLQGLGPGIQYTVTDFFSHGVVLKKLFLFVVKAAVSLEIIWLVAGNIALNTGIGPAIAGIRPDKFTLDWDKGWTLYPLQFEARGATMNIHTWSTDAEISADRVSGRVAILPFLQKRAVFEGLHAGTVGVAISREKPEGERPAPTKPYPGLTIEIADGVVDAISHVSFNRVSLSGGQGGGRASASIQVRGDKSIGPVEAEWRGAEFHVDENRLPKTIDITASGGIAPFNPREDRGPALLEKISGHVTVEGQVGTLVPLQYLFPGMEWIERIDGDGEIAIDARLENGRLLDGTTLDVSATSLLLEFLGYSAHGSGRVTGAVREVNGDTAGEIRIVFDDYDLSRQGIELPLLRGTNLSLEGSTPTLDPERVLSEFNVRLDIPESEIPDITTLGEYLPPTLGISVESGSARIQGGITVDGASQAAEARLGMEGVGIGGKFRDTVFTMDMSLASEASGQKLNDYHVDLGGTEFRLFNGVFDNENVDVDDHWWMNITVPSGMADLSQPFAVEADVDLEMKDTRAIVALFAEIKEWISRFDGFLTVQDVSGHASVSASNKSLRVRDLAVAGDRLELVAEVSADGERNDAIVWGKLGIFSGGFERRADETDWKLVNGRKWYEERKQEHWSDQASGDGANASVTQ